jgi:hypothetical protein
VDAHGEHILVGRVALARLRLCHATRFACRNCARAGITRTLCHTPWAGPVTHRPSELHWLGCVAATGMGRMVAFGPFGQSENRNFFSILFQFKHRFKFLKNHIFLIKAPKIMKLIMLDS